MSKGGICLKHKGLPLDEWVIFLMGYPAIGKGTQAKMMAETFELLHFSSGEILRQNDRAQRYIKARRLVPDNVYFPAIGSAMEAKLGNKKSLPGVVLDGVVRHGGQVVPIISRCKGFGYKKFVVLEYTGLTGGELLRRMEDRRQAEHRVDDTSELLKVGIQQYADTRLEIIDAFKLVGCPVVSVNASGNPETVFTDSLLALKPIMGIPR